MRQAGVMKKTPAYLLEDEDEVKRLIRENPWATIVSCAASGLVASHYPVLLEEAEAGISIVSHVGRPDERLHEHGEHYAQPALAAEMRQVHGG